MRKLVHTLIEVNDGERNDMRLHTKYARFTVSALTYVSIEKMHRHHWRKEVELCMIFGNFFEIYFHTTVKQFCRWE
jgi:hypothetical protein